MEMTKAVKTDLPRIEALIAQAKLFLKKQGVDQWQDGYPDAGDLARDVNSGIGYVCKEDGRILAYTAIDFRGEPAYRSLQGHWLNEAAYVVIHRMAVDNTVKGKGLAQKVFRMVETMALKKGVENVRVDTDEANHSMRHIIEKAGYTYCGHITFANSDKIAFQKYLGQVEIR